MSSAAQYFKNMSIAEIRQNSQNFIIGLIVASISSILLLKSMNFQGVFQIFHIPNLFSAPAVESVPIDKVVASQQANGGTGGSYSAPAYPTNTPYPTILPTETPLLTPTMYPTLTPTSSPTPIVEQGEISAISSKRVTFKGSEYIVQQGEGLSAIAEKVYGDPNMWTVIAEANNLTSPNQIEIGMKLKIPKNPIKK